MQNRGKTTEQIREKPTERESATERTNGADQHQEREQMQYYRVVRFSQYNRLSSVFRRFSKIIFSRSAKESSAKQGDSAPLLRRFASVRPFTHQISQASPESPQKAQKKRYTEQIKRACPEKQNNAVFSSFRMVDDKYIIHP